MSRVQTPAGSESMLDFPAGGLDESAAFVKQRKSPGPDGSVLYTTADALNVRAFDAGSDRRRGGSRPGADRYLNDPINHPVGLDPYSIQNLDQMVGVTADPAGLYGPFAMGAAAGYKLGSRLGVGYFGGSSGVFACSCWDYRTANAYVACVTGKDLSTVTVSRVDSAGAGAELWADAYPLTSVAGMAVCGDYLYVAEQVAADGSYRVAKISLADGSGADAAWVSNAGIANLRFSSGAVNCLAAADRFLGVVVCGNGGAITNNFLVLDTATARVFASTGAQGVDATSSACKADSDGKFFYASINVAKKVQCVTADGAVVWTYTATDDNNTVAYDKPANRLYVLGRDTGVLKTVNCSTGQLANAVPAPGGSSAWRSIDTDGSGNAVLWKPSVASNDSIAIGEKFATVWGPSTIANANHAGASAMRGTQGAGRVWLLAWAGGRLSRFDRNAATPVGTPRRWSPTAEVIFSRQNGRHVYAADGVGYARYNADTDAAELWVPTAGTLPVDDRGRACRLIDTWRIRTVLAGLRGQPQNYFMTRRGDPLDIGYGPAFPSADDPVAGDNCPAGLVGDAINTMIPYSDDILVWGCDHSIWQMRGDPADGGENMLVSSVTGMAFGRPWCRDPDGTIYFVGSRGQVYSMVPGERKPVWMSQQVSDRLRKIDVSPDRTAIRMAWDDAAKGFHLFITPFDKFKATEHWFWDARVEAWWPVALGHRDFNPKAVLEADGDESDDRVILVGSWDSHVRAFEGDFGSDDGVPFDAYVTLGPFLTDGLGRLMLHEVQGHMADDSAAVAWQLRSGRTCRAALRSGPVISGTFAPGRNPTRPVRRSGAALYLRVSGAGPWAMEQVRVRLQDLGPVLRRNG